MKANAIDVDAELSGEPTSELRWELRTRSRIADQPEGVRERSVFGIDRARLGAAIDARRDRDVIRGLIAIRVERPRELARRRAPLLQREIVFLFALRIGCGARAGAEEFT
ncbi:MAG TPA: hypothetical protein VL463_05930 [Kofleriaceae bacterium]|nr:hypothetical protein [Kofleriaceae bacterium]